MRRIGRLLLAWLAVAIFQLIAFHPGASTPIPLAAGFFVLLLAAIFLSSFGVLEEANALAERLGEPYGSLILTISVLIIEVVLIAAVMLGPTPAPQIGRDSIYSVMMIIMNLVVGAAIVLGTRGHQKLPFNRRGTHIYIVMIAVFGAIAFLTPHFFKPYTGSLPTAWGAGLATVVGLSYVAFLVWQMGRGRALFQDHPVPEATPTQGGAPSPASPSRGPSQGARAERETTAGSEDVAESEAGAVGNAVAGGRAMAGSTQRLDSTWVRAGILVLLLVAIALLAEHLGIIIDFGVQQAHLPQALGGLVIAAIVFTPETLTALQAAIQGEMQRVVNLCLGAFVSTIGMTFPSVVILGLLTGKEVVFGLDGISLILFVLTVLLTALTFRQRFATPAYGVAHLALFATFTVTVFAL